jgi:hypothetical protein
VLFQLPHCEAQIVLGDNVIFVPTEEAVDKLSKGSLGGNAFIAYE